MKPQERFGLELGEGAVVRSTYGNSTTPEKPKSAQPEGCRNKRSVVWVLTLLVSNLDPNQLNRCEERQKTQCKHRRYGTQFQGYGTPVEFNERSIPGHQCRGSR